LARQRDIASMWNSDTWLRCVCAELWPGLLKGTPFVPKRVLLFFRH